MPVAPAELTAEFTVAGPEVRAALDAGAHRLDVRLEAPAESR